MSKFYNPSRTRNKFDPQNEKPFKISRSKIELFMKCPKCFFLDRRLGLSVPPGYPFNLNSAVDALLKKEFDIYRERKCAHPLMEAHDVSAIPFSHPNIELWRDALRGGLAFHHVESNFIITGGLDDVWIDSDGWLNVVDYKATSKATEVNIDADWQIGYKRQIEIYQWLLRNNNFLVSDVGYFVYCNGDTSLPEFNQTLKFDVRIIPYVGNDSWIEEIILKMREVLMSPSIPSSSDDCDICAYSNELINTVYGINLYDVLSQKS